MFFMLSEKSGPRGQWAELGVVVADDKDTAVRKVGLRILTIYERIEEDGFRYIHIEADNPNGVRYSLESMREITEPLAALVTYGKKDSTKNRC